MCCRLVQLDTQLPRSGAMAPLSTGQAGVDIKVVERSALLDERGGELGHAVGKQGGDRSREVGSLAEEI